MKKILGLVVVLLFTLPAFATDLDPCRNLVDEMKIGSLSGLDGSYIEANTRAVTKNFISVTPDTYYSFNVTGNDFFIYDIYAYDSNKTFLRSLDHPSANNVSVQIPSEGAYIKYSVRKNDNSQVTLNDFQTYMKLASCVQIQVATKKYNDTAFSPVMTALNGAISTIKTVVTNTINQAAAVSALQTGKQTMPNTSGTNGTCPNYKQCLLVETSDGTPQWFVITDPFRDFVTPILATNTAPSSTTETTGYTQLEYIESTGTQWIDTGITVTANNTTKLRIEIDGNFGTGVSGQWSIDGSAYPNKHNYIGLNPSSRLVYGNANDIVTNYSEQDRTGRHLYVVDYLNGYVKRDNVTITNFTAQVGSHPDHDLFIFGWTKEREKQQNAKKYGVKIYNNGTLVRDFVPVRQNATGKYGMYDKVNNVFYPNAASSGNDFTPGPEVLDQDPGVPGMTWTATWTANADGVAAGTVNGVARCTSVTTSNTSSTANPTRYSQLTSAQQTQFNTPFTASTVSNYNVCWCKITDINTGGESASSSTANWTHYGIPGNNTVFDCTSGCTQRCRSSMGEFATRAGFIKAMFGQ